MEPQPGNTAAIHIVTVLRSMAPEAYNTLHDFIVDNDFIGLKECLWDMTKATLVDGQMSNDKDYRSDYIAFYETISKLLLFLFDFFGDAVRRTGITNDQQAELN